MKYAILRKTQAKALHPFMQADPIHDMVKILRAHALSDVEAFAVAMALLAWAKLSVREELSEALRIRNALVHHQQLAIKDVLSAATKMRGDGLLNDLIRLQNLKDEVIKPLVTLAHFLAISRQLDGLPIEALLPRGTAGPQPLPTELASLIVRLGDVAQSESVYIPWDFYAQLAIGAHAGGYIETPIHSNVPRLIQVLSDTSFEVRYSDPVLAPSYVEPSGGLRKFEVGLGVPPIGLRYDKREILTDRSGRFPENTSSGCVLAIRQLLSQAQRRVVVVVPNSLLSNSGAERTLRNDLLSRGMVEAVIALPAGLLETPSIASAILVLKPEGGHRHVRLIDTEGSPFCKSTSRGRSKLTNLDQLCAVTLLPEGQEADKRYTAVVPTSELLRNDGTMQVNRYVLPPTTRFLASRLASRETFVLGELVRTIRPLRPTTQKDVPLLDAAALIHEVGTLDIPQHGYIQNAGRQISISRATLNAASQLFIKPMDIVLIVKGSVGKVGIVAIDAPAPGPGGWVVSQPGIILRVDRPESLDPRILYMLLRSPIGQHKLRNIVAGTTTPLIQLRELMALSLPLPTIVEQEKALKALETEHRLQIQIDQLRAEQGEAASELWALEQLESELTDDEAPARSGPLQVLSQ